MFEIVEIQKQQGHLIFVPVRPLELMLQAGFEEGAVGKAGQTVEKSQAFQLLLGGFDHAYIGKDPDAVDQLIVGVLYRVDGQPFRVYLAIFAPVPDLSLPDAFLPDAAPHLGIKGAIMTSGFHEAGIIADGFGGSIAGNPGKRRIHLDYLVSGIGNDDRFGGALEHLGGQHQAFVHLA